MEKLIKKITTKIIKKAKIKFDIDYDSEMSDLKNGIEKAFLNFKFETPVTVTAAEGEIGNDDTVIDITMSNGDIISYEEQTNYTKPGPSKIKMLVNNKNINAKSTGAGFIHTIRTGYEKYLKSK